MHYKGFVIVAQATKEALDTIMVPFEGKYWDWWRVGGRYDGALQGIEEQKKRATGGGFNFSPNHEQLDLNKCLAKDLPADATAFFYLFEGNWVASESWVEGAPSKYNLGGAMVDNESFQEDLQKVLRDHPDYWVIVIDVHN